jgi:predicted kinase
MKLIVFSGLPGTGKSSLAEAVGRALHIPVFAKDWLEATLLRRGLRPTVEDKRAGICGLRTVDRTGRTPAHARTIGYPG